MLARRHFRGRGDSLVRKGKHVAVGALAGAVGIAATTATLRKVMSLGPLARVPMWGRAVIEVLVGVGGYFLLDMVDEDAAVGWAGGVAGFGLASLTMGFFDQPVTLGGARNLRGIRGLRGASIQTGRPGAPRLAPVQRPSPIAGRFGAAVVSQQRVPAHLLG